MKKILVIGENSYIGRSFAAFAHDRYEVIMVNSRHEAWRKTDFSGCTSALHCVGIAHVSRDPRMEDSYYEVNCHLAVSVAQKAKAAGVKQFIFLSSILVYGSGKKEIDLKTIPQPDDFYGGSKLKAEQELQRLADDSFKVCIVRPPLVYGRDCKGNFPRLVKLAKTSPLFPDFPNQRSMIYIDNLCNFIGNLIDGESRGVFLPQNQEYVNTTALVKSLAKCQGRRIATTKIFNPLIRLLASRAPFFGKIFGDLYYARQGNEDEYNIVGFEDSVRQSSGRFADEKKCLMVASVASMIGQFNMPNIALLQAKGYAVTVAANFSFGNTFGNKHADTLRDELVAGGIEVYDIKFMRNVFALSNITAYKQIKKLINDNNYALIHCHSPIGGVISRLAAKKKRGLGTRVIYTAHGFHFYKGANWRKWFFYYPVEKWLSRYTDALITINREDYFLASTKMKAKRTYYLPGIGIETRKYMRAETERAGKRSELNIPAEAIVIVSIGELSKRKNHQAAIKSLSTIKSDRLFYIICGLGDLQERLQKLAKRRGIDDRVLLLGYRTDTAEILQMSDIFLFPSLQEGLPVALMEAMAAGLPCVVSKIRGNVDLLEDNKGGFLCGARNIGEYSRAIGELLKNNDMRRDMGEYNQKAVQAFDLDVVMGKMAEIYICGGDPLSTK
ncbi:MAG: glycosyltransferase [Lachnospiraceae bacterium]|jgi:glycosyltransferase involved in cell wall biosynthesis/dTDP-4-dehydrorhamnose reductase|nr:glycosyltransferase [Lachnospiraceae bacterium]